MMQQTAMHLWTLFSRAYSVVFPGQAAPAAATTPTQTEVQRGDYGRYRANDDLLYYHLDIRLDPTKKTISRKNTGRSRMLKDNTRIQLERGNIGNCTHFSDQLHDRTLDFGALPV
jgi:hypothetical protein